MEGSVILKMSSVCIKDLQGQTLIKIYHRKGAFWVDRIKTLSPFDVIIRDEKNHKVIIPSRANGKR